MNGLLLIITTNIIVLSRASDNRKPIWNIAHMINNRDQIDEYLNKGANAIEVDVQYDESSGELLQLYHGFPCDILRVCSRKDDIVPYLQEIRERATPSNNKYNPNLTLIYFDNKVSDIDEEYLDEAGQNLAESIIDAQLFPSQIYVIVGIYELSHINYFKGFIDHINDNGYQQYLDRIGYEFSDEKDTDPYTIISEFKSAGIDSNIWVSKGRSNWFEIVPVLPTYKFEDSLKARDDKSTPITKVYGWTTDKEITMENWMYEGLDGLITNHPDRFVNVLKYESLKTTHRLATSNDNPFEKKLNDLAQVNHYYQCSYNLWRLGHYCRKTCGKYPDMDDDNDWCWTDLECDDDESVCQDVTKQQECHDENEEAVCNIF